MISKFEMKNFKGHEDWSTIRLRGLTPITGTNNSGKSSIMQGLYLLSQNDNINQIVTLKLNRDLELGEFSDVLNKEKMNDDSIEFAITFDNKFVVKDELRDLSIHFIYKDISALNIDKTETDIPVLTGMVINSIYKEQDINYIIKLDEESKDLLYRIQGNETGYCEIQGVRIGEILYADNSKNSERKIISDTLATINKYLSKISNQNIKYLRNSRVASLSEGSKNTKKDGIGVTGEYTAEVIYKRFNEQVDFYNEEGVNYKFSQLFDYWIKKIIGESYQVRTEKPKEEYEVFVEDTSYPATLKLKLNQVGFGITQMLPILTMILTSNEGDILLIENPEIHMHPKLQADIVELVVYAMKNGRKIVVETHSEHVINRIRLEVKKKIIDLNQLDIYFYEKVDGVIKSDEIEVDGNGKLSHWPRFFFDQSYHDLLGLIKDEHVL